MRRRLSVLCGGLAVGALLSLIIAGPLMPSGMGLRARATIWVAVMGGPVWGSTWDISSVLNAVAYGWLGLLLVPAHPMRPHWATGLLTAIGLALWFFVGFITVLVAVWGH